MSELIKAYPKEFRRAAESAVAGFLADIEREPYANTLEYFAQDDASKRPLPGYSNLIDAVRFLGNSAKSRRGLILIPQPYIAYMTIREIPLTGLRFVNAVCYQMELVGCEADDMSFVMRAAEKVVFSDVSWVRGHLHIADPHGKVQSTGTDAIEFFECDLSSSRMLVAERPLRFVRCNLNGMSVTAGSVDLEDCWFIDKEPTFTLDTAFHTDTVPVFRLEADGPELYTTDRGWRVLSVDGQEAEELDVLKS
jgi:hypothetical protein